MKISYAINTQQYAFVNGKKKHILLYVYVLVNE
jgi:hypothetical protein